jgi:hypothetical protein
VQFYDVSRLRDVRASIYVGVLARRGERLGQWFARQKADAVAVVGVPRPGIYARGGEMIFGGGESGMYFLLHEMTHLAYNDLSVDTDLDRYLGQGLGLMRGPNESWSDAVSRFFNSRCTKKGP